MSKFKITWPTGKVETVEQESATTVDEFVNIHFGIMAEAVAENGTTVELVLEAEPELDFHPEQDVDPENPDGTHE
jgi:hypothetical protein